MSTPSDELFLRRAIRLAMNGRGLVEPNPMVGCVLVKNGQIIGEGWHGQFGGPHAEPTALADCRSHGNSPEGATAYVTLEPCCHTNKKTPPCVPALIEAKVARGVIGCLDPNPDVNGKGVTLLRDAGIEVTTGVCEGEAKQLIAPFLLSVLQTRPYVTLKWAQSADGKVAGIAGQRLQISGVESQRLVHELRSRVGGILVGVSTILIDDPLLNARYSRNQRHPARFILDSRLRTPIDAKVVTDDSAKTTVFYAYQTRTDVRKRRDALEERYVGTMMLAADASNRVAIAKAVEDVRRHYVSELLVEPGPTLAASFFNSGLVDRVWVFRSPTRLNENSAPSAAPIPDDFVKTGELNVGDDVLSEYLNPKCGAFFAAVPSADFVMARDEIVDPSRS